MKTLKHIIVGLALLLTYTATAQQGINYKALIKDGSGNALANTFMNVVFTIHSTSAVGTIVYQEDHNFTTDANGLLILTIGTDASPSVGVFSALDWTAGLRFLQTTITYSGGTINFDATEFKAVPYAKHAKTAETAANVFSGDYNDLINQPTIINPTGLIRITENFKTGWRLPESYDVDYESIGFRARDLSRAVNSSEGSSGATGSISISLGVNSLASGSKASAFGTSTIASGDWSTVMGYQNEAMGSISTAMGQQTLASGYASTAMGIHTIASNNGSLAIGKYNIDVPNALFIVGNGFFGNPDNTRRNALVVLENGNIGIGNDTPSSLLEVAHKNGSASSESLSILNTDTSNAWQFHTTNYLNLYQNGVFKGSWNATSGAYVQASDRRVKKDIIALDNKTLDKVMQLNPVSYLMKDQTDTKRNIGLISQEVQEIFPSITHYVEESDLLALSYTELIPVLIKATQEQQEIIEEQQENNKSQQQQIDELKRLVNNMLNKD